ncbi:MAG: hypothetical protein J0M17_21385 [Planctomycetes bacterium]|nr:hypothetical protein [Planctomycetota bacterium]
MSNYLPKANPLAKRPPSRIARAQVVGLGIAGVLLPAAGIEAASSGEWGCLAVPPVAALFWVVADWCEEFLAGSQPRVGRLSDPELIPNALWLSAANNRR